MNDAVDGVWIGDGRCPGVAWSRRPGAGVAAVRLFIAGGSSADDTRPGLTHVFEHVLASVTAPAGMLVSGETGREYLAVSVRCLPSDAGKAVRWLNRAATTNTGEGPVREAVSAAAREASRAYEGRAGIWNVLAVSLWGEHPLGRPTMGERAAIHSIDTEAVDRHRRRLLVAGGVWLGVAGDIEPDRMIGAARELDWRLGPEREPWPVPPLAGVPGKRVVAGGGADPIVAAAWPVPGGFGLDAQALRLTEAIIGGARGRLARFSGGFAALALYREAGYMAALARPRRGEEDGALDRLLAAVCAVPGDEEIGRARRIYPVRALAELDGSFRAAGAAALHALTGGPPPGRWIEDVAGCPADAVTAAFRRLTPECCHVLVVRG